MQKQELIKKPEQYPIEELFDDQLRIYRGWASVEIKDSQGDLLPMSEFKKIMPIIMDRGGNILDSHSNRHTGKILNYQFLEHPETRKEGLFLEVKNFNGYIHDDVIWNKIKSGEYTGFSFGCMAVGRPTIKFEDGMDITKIIDQFEGFEFSNVEVPANKPSLYTEINYLAKSGKKKEASPSIRLLELTKSMYNRNLLTILLSDKKNEKFIYKSSHSITMPDENNNPNAGQDPDANSVDQRVARLEEAVAKILEMLQSNMQMSKAKEEEDEKEKKES